MKRRKFIKSIAPAGIMVPSFVQGIGFKAFNTGHTFLNQVLLPTGDNNRVLVIVQLNGGNDGLNTVIPIDNYSQYVNARKNIFIDESKVLKLRGHDRVGLHPSMIGMQQLFNEDKLHIVQSVGYAQPNFSHFRATDIWMSASDSKQVLTSGWLGRFLDEAYPGFPAGYPNINMPDPLAIQIGSVASLTLQGPIQPMGMSISNPSSFYNLVNNREDAAPNTLAGMELSYIRETSRQAQKFSEVIKAANAKVIVQNLYPTGNTLADQLKIVARLIKGGLKTKIYIVNYGGFDTHANQVESGNNGSGTHARLLGNVSAAIKAFMDDLVYLGIDDRVLGMTFSEFGRRILSNASRGTDHGAAAPLFVFGTRVQGGISGSNPIIPTNVGVGDNIPFQYDFRSVYASILSNWLCVDDTLLNTVLLKNFQNLPLTKLGTCSVLKPVGDPENLLVLYPNPFYKSVAIQFKTIGGHTLLQILDGAGRLVKILYDKEVAEGTYRVDFNGEYLPPGIYYVRLQNQLIQQVKSILKV
ncbi:MAG: hypothetical protein RL000_1026 [Bacteroidota bacterium]|jgi:uncharacterized protein (DUF1501 family)